MKNEIEKTYEESSLESVTEGRPDSSTVSAAQPLQTPDQPLPSIASMSPDYPKHRDALIVGSILCFLIVLLAGAYFIVNRLDTNFQEFTKNPTQYLSNLIVGPEVYQVCGEYVRNHEDRFSQLGKILTVSPTKVQIRSINGRKSAEVTLKVEGSRETANIHFSLQKQQKRWRIKSVLLEENNGLRENVQRDKKVSSPPMTAFS
jgi:hypothetical protein